MDGVLHQGLSFVTPSISLSYSNNPDFSVNEITGNSGCWKYLSMRSRKTQILKLYPWFFCIELTWPSFGCDIEIEKHPNWRVNETTLMLALDRFLIDRLANSRFISFTLPGSNIPQTRCWTYGRDSPVMEWNVVERSGRTHPKVEHIYVSLPLVGKVIIIIGDLLEDPSKNDFSGNLPRKSPNISKPFFLPITVHSSFSVLGRPYGLDFKGEGRPRNWCVVSFTSLHICSRLSLRPKSSPASNSIWSWAGDTLGKRLASKNSSG